MSLKTYTHSVDGTIPVQALLFDQEELLASQDNIGIYDASEKSANHQNGTIHVTSHRLFYIDNTKPYKYSFYLDLHQVSRTDYYAGLFKSSPKVTLYLAATSVDRTVDSWDCEVCAYRNPPGLSNKCSLCGVPRASASKNTPSSLPSSAPSTSNSSYLTCPACTFLNHPSLRQCEICGTLLSMKSAPSSRPATPALDASSSTSMKVSFRRGGDKAFYGTLKRTLQSKAREIPARTADASRSTGISGIMRSVESTAQATTDSLDSALKDLETLMLKAKDMVRLASELNERLTATGAESEPEEATFIRNSLSQLGLHMPNAPVTQDMLLDEDNWVEELAKELAAVLQGSPSSSPYDRREDQTTGLMKQRGIVALDEVWGGWNRARGVALISPTTFLSTLNRLPMYTLPPIRLRVLPSGLKVLHTPPFTQAAFAARISGILTLSGPKNTLEIALEEDITAGLAGEMMTAMENDGEVLRDDSGSTADGRGLGGGEIFWWMNTLKDYVWDGQTAE